MGTCPVCNSEIAEQTTTCPICNSDLESDQENGGKWLVLGLFKDQVSAGLAHEALLNADIPAVLFSKAGFFGAAGLAMNQFYSPSEGLYEISVPKQAHEDATDIVNAVMGGQWHPRSIDDQDENSN